MNHDINKLLEHYQTPLYLFDIHILKQRIDYLKKHLPNNIDLCYAMKANPFLIKEIEEDIEKLEVCSPGEYYICKENHIRSDKLVISGVYKSLESIEEMMKDGVRTFTIESLHQLELLDILTKKYQQKISLLLRLTSGNQFGMNKEEIKTIIHQRKEYPFFHFKGIQYFSGTQKTLTKRLKKECQRLDEFLIQLEQEENYQVEELEFGGGFPVHYFDDGKDIDEKQYLFDFSEIIHSMHYQGKIILELGRSIAASCGYYMTRVVDMKQNQNGNYAILDGGMHHLTYYGQMMAMKHPYHSLYPYRENNEPIMWNLCGALCTINDLIVKQLSVSHLKINDIFVFKNTGAYCMSEGISLFLSRDLPKVIFYKNNQYELIRDEIPTYPLNCQRKGVKIWIL